MNIPNEINQSLKTKDQRAFFQFSSIYPITDTQISGLSHAAQVEKLIDGGAKLIQLREKYASPQIFFEEAKKAVSLAHRRNCKIIINDRADIALAARADGVHLGQDDLPPDAARRILGEKAIIGFSTHNLAQIEAAKQMPLDYIAVGPVFSTKTKENPDEIIGLENLLKLRQIILEIPLVAIGGITLQNFRSVLQAGANSAAVISDLIANPDAITARLNLFLSAQSD